MSSRNSRTTRRLEVKVTRVKEAEKIRGGGQRGIRQGSKNQDEDKRRTTCVVTKESQSEANKLSVHLISSPVYSLIFDPVNSGKFFSYRFPFQLCFLVCHLFVTDDDSQTGHSY